MNRKSLAWDRQPEERRVRSSWGHVFAPAKEARHVTPRAGLASKWRPPEDRQ